METQAPSSLPCDDPTRMGQLLARLEPRLTAVARRLLRNSDAAADVVQNAFEKVIRRCEQYRGGAQASTWMHRIVVNEALMWLRREKRYHPDRIHPADWELMFAAATDPEHLAVRDQACGRLRRAAERLAPEERRLLQASVVEGRSYRDLAHDEGVSSSALKSRAFRARRRLARELEAL